MEQRKHNYFLLYPFIKHDDFENDICRRRYPESFHQFSQRTNDGLPLTSEQEELFNKEEAEIAVIKEKRANRRYELFWNSFPLIMRNWKKILKYPALSNISIDQQSLTGLRGITLGALMFAWSASFMRCVCPDCQGTAYFIPFAPYPDCSRCYIFCSSCGKENTLYENEDWRIMQFRTLLERWKHFCHPAESTILFERALHLLKLSEIYEEDPKEFGEPHSFEIPRRKFSDENATGEELIALLREDEPYQLEGASRNTLLGIYHNYDKLTLPPSDVKYDLDYGFDGFSTEDLSELDDEFSPENMSDEMLKEDIKGYESLWR